MKQLPQWPWCWHTFYRWKENFTLSRQPFQTLNLHTQKIGRACHNDKTIQII